MSRLLSAWIAPVTVLVAASGVAAQEESTGSPPDLAAEVAAAVDLPTERERREAVRRLVDLDQPLDRWLSALTSFGEFESHEPGHHRAEVPLPVGDVVETTSIAYFVPRDYDPARPAPLLLALHGTGGTGEREPVMWASVAEEVGMIVVAPTEAGPNQGYRYSDRERGASLATVRWARRRFNVDEHRVFGRFEAEGERVDRFELLLDESMFVPGERVVVRWGGKEVKRHVRPSVRVLLTEFVERFDRTFLPVVRVEIR